MPNYHVKKCGPERTFDHAKIKEMIYDGKKDAEIAKEIGCTPGYVGEIRWKSSEKKRWLWECRVC